LHKMHLGFSDCLNYTTKHLRIQVEKQAHGCSSCLYLSFGLRLGDVCFAQRWIALAWLYPW
jgi:hypothetical protein